MIDYYKLSLELMLHLLKGEGYENWEKWLLEDLRLWENEKNTEHHLRAYGGMGSFNDVPLGTNDLKSIWKNKIFGMLQSISYGLANKTFSTPPINEAFYGSNLPQLSGWRCQNCGHAIINSRDIEIYISSFFLPKFFIEYIKQDKLAEIIGFEKLILSEKVSSKRQTIEALIKNSGIVFLEKNDWLTTCPKCYLDRICSYRWELIENDSELIEAEDNLSIKYL